MKKIDTQLAEFLYHSNAIEDIFYPLDYYLENYDDKYTAIKNSYLCWDYLIKINPYEDKCNLHNVINNAHKILMKDILFAGKQIDEKIIEDNLGKYRTCNVTIPTKNICIDTFMKYNIITHEREKCIAPDKIKIHMKKLFKMFERAFSEYELWKTHLYYEVIHPHIDGNGRLGRIIWNWLRYQSGYGIKIIKCEDRHKYYEEIKAYREKVLLK